MIGVRWFSITPGSGFGNSSEDYLSGLRAADIPVSWVPMGWSSGLWHGPYGPVPDADLRRFTHRDIANISVEHDNVVVHSAPVWHEQLKSDSVGRNLTAFTTWETDRLPPTSVEILNRFDRVIVPSRFNSVVFESSGVQVPIRVVPHIARRVGARGPEHVEKDDRFTFYLISAWTTRKAILDSVEAYLSAFSRDDDVVMVIHTTVEDLIALARMSRDSRRAERPGADREGTTWNTLARALSGRSSAPEIVLSTRSLSRPEVDALHARGNCFVSLSRGEGWGLGAFEAAAFGNPVIVTGWGATPEFLPEGYPYLVGYELVPTVSDEPDAWYFPSPGDHWAKARIPEAASMMRHVYENREEAVALGRTLQNEVSSNFESEKVTRLLLEALGDGDRRASSLTRV